MVRRCSSRSLTSYHPCFPDIRRITPHKLSAKPSSRPHGVRFVFPPHQPWLPFLHSQLNPHLSTSTEQSALMITAPLHLSFLHNTQMREVCLQAQKSLNFHQSLFNPPSSVNILPNTDWRSLSVISGKRNILHQSLHKSTFANTAANPVPITNIFKGPVCALPACVDTASPPAPPRDASFTTSKGYLNIPSFKVATPTIIQQQFPTLFQTHRHCFGCLIIHLIM